MSIKIVEERFEVGATTDPLFCSIQVKRIASQVGFGSRGQWELAIAVKELVTNAVSHAGGGVLTIRAHSGVQNSGQPRTSLEIQVEDDGPGIEDLSRAVMDGYSCGRFVNGERFDVGRRGLGAGLGTVKRLMDSVEFENKREGGLLVRAYKHLP